MVFSSRSTSCRLSWRLVVRPSHGGPVSEHRYNVDGYSTASPEVVFAVLVDGPGWAGWAPGVKAASYECEGDPAPHGVGAIRRFGAGRGPVSREQVVAYEEPSYFSYVALSGPLPWQGYCSEVRLSPGPTGVGTTIDWRGSFRSRVPGLGTFIHRMVAGFATGLAAEAERQAGHSAPA
jgi:hypothetical protein